MTIVCLQDKPGTSFVNISSRREGPIDFLGFVTFSVITIGQGRRGKLKCIILYQRTDEPALEARNYTLQGILGQDNIVSRHLLSILYFLSIIRNYHAQFKLQRP